MRTRFFLPCLIVLVVSILALYGYSIQNPALVVTAYLNLSVRSESNREPGFGWILEQNTSFSLIKWPQPAVEEIEVVSSYAFNETRTTPVQFAVSFCLDRINRTVLTRNLTITGGYSAVVSSTFASIERGTHNLTIAVYVPGFEEDKTQLNWTITIP